MSSLWNHESKRLIALLAGLETRSEQLEIELLGVDQAVIQVQNEIVRKTLHQQGIHPGDRCVLQWSNVPHVECIYNGTRTSYGDNGVSIEVQYFTKRGKPCKYGETIPFDRLGVIRPVAAERSER